EGGGGGGGGGGGRGGGGGEGRGGERRGGGGVPRERTGRGRHPARGSEAWSSPTGARGRREPRTQGSWLGLRIGRVEQAADLRTVTVAELAIFVEMSDQTAGGAVEQAVGQFAEQAGGRCLATDASRPEGGSVARAGLC